MTKRHALVAGATGIVGRRIAERLHEGGWAVTGVCRSPPAGALPYRLIAADLTDGKDCRAKLAPLTDVTHVFYAARYDHPEGERESVDVNAGMLVNLIDAIEPASPALRHIHAVHGTKYYGHMLGPGKVPYREDDPRAPLPNFYFAHEDFLREQSRGATWAYTTSRPHTFCDSDAAEPRNAALLIALHATLCRALDQPFIFPGTIEGFAARTQFTFVPLLARAIEWMATTPACAGQSYNVTNGDSPRWSELWPSFAKYFEVPEGVPEKTRLADQVESREAAWQTLTRRFDLEPAALSTRVLWPYADYLFAPGWDIISSMEKLRRDGFGETLDTARMFVGLFDEFRRDRIIP